MDSIVLTCTSARKQHGLLNTDLTFFFFLFFFKSGHIHGKYLRLGILKESSWLFTNQQSSTVINVILSFCESLPNCPKRDLPNFTTSPVIQVKVWCREGFNIDVIYNIGRYTACSGSMTLSLLELVLLNTLRQISIKSVQT